MIPRYTTYSRHSCAETHGLCLATGRCGKRLERFLEVAVDVLILARNKSQVPLGSLEEASVIKAPPRLVPFNTRGDCFTEYLKFNREDMEVGLVSIFPMHLQWKVLWQACGKLELENLNSRYFGIFV